MKSLQQFKMRRSHVQIPALTENAARRGVARRIQVEIVNRRRGGLATLFKC